MTSTVDYTKQFDAVKGTTVEGCSELVNHSNFSHTRMGNGCWREVVWIYHRCSDSPSGFVLVGSTTEDILKQVTTKAPRAPYFPDMEG